MIIYLTSDPGTVYKEDCEDKGLGLNKDNGFVDSLKKYWKDNSKVLIFASDPFDEKMNKENVAFVKQAWPYSGLTISKVDICDDKHRELVDKINEYDFILLSGGHVPTEHKFFKELNLREKLASFNGILMGISAGTMIQASNVYSLPELEGESLDPNYKRFLDGLGFTRLNIIPHYQYLNTVILDGKKMIEEIALEDSYRKKFYGIVDGAYVLIKDRVSTLYGEGYLISEGKIELICKKDQSRVLEG